MVTETELKSVLEQIDRLERELAGLRTKLADMPRIERRPLEGLWGGVTFSGSEAERTDHSLEG
jgi:hypothetical protein